MFKTNLLTLSLLMLFLSCGKKANDKNNEIAREEVLEGTYTAVLYPVNGKLSSKVNGKVHISRYGDQFTVNVHLKDAPAGLHKQQLHSGSSCPDISHDSNGDGYTDMSESRQYLGDIVLPFDDDLSSYHLGSTFIPSGSYRYSRSTSYYLLLSEMELNGEDLPIENRVVSIFSSSPVGEIPLACGILKKSSETPSSGQWEEDTTRSPRPSPTRRTPRPRPDPDVYEPDEPEPPRNPTWWERLRQRWNNWRERARNRRDDTEQPLNNQDFI